MNISNLFSKVKVEYLVNHIVDFLVGIYGVNFKLDPSFTENKGVCILDMRKISCSVVVVQSELFDKI